MPGDALERPKPCGSPSTYATTNETSPSPTDLPWRGKIHWNTVVRRHGQEPIYLAYSERATAGSFVPLITARPSLNTVTS